MSDIFNAGYLPLHLLNILVHVGFGTLAIVLGFAQFLTRKGGVAHAWIGRVYLAFYSIVVSTAVIGSIAFGFRAFLAALTLSAAYWLIAGLRVLAIRNTGPKLLDNVVSWSFIAAAATVFVVMRVIPEQSTPAANIALVHLTLLCLYDLSRNLNGKAWLRRSWLNEHIYKMIGSHAAMISAAGGNLFLALQPWSIFVPPTLSLILIAGFIIRHKLPRPARSTPVQKAG